MPDHRPLLAAAGLPVEVYDETAELDRRQRAIAERLLDSVDELAIESGEDPAILRQELEEMAGDRETMSRRVLMVARRVEPRLGLTLRVGGSRR